MTRLEENRMLVEEVAKSAEAQPTGTHEERVTFLLSLIATMLADISKSQAILADKMESELINKIVDEIEQEIEREKVNRSVFRGEIDGKKDAVKAEECTGSIYAYRNVIAYIDKYTRGIKTAEGVKKE